MKKQGYLIAKNSLTEAYFTSSSSYDRPTWLEPAKATCYPTVELAEAALKKLLRNGAYTARLVPVQEALSIELPDEDPAADPRAAFDPNGDPDAPPTDGESEDDDQDDMVASDQSGDPDAPPVGDGDPGDEAIEAEVDQLLGNESDPALSTGDDEQLDTEEMPSSNDPQTSDDLPLQKGEADTEGGLDLPGMDDEDELGDEQNLPVREMALAIKSLTPINDFGSLSDEGDGSKKVKVPAGVISDLNSVKTDYERQAKFAGTNSDHGGFALTVAGSMEELIALLKQGDVNGVKQAQLKLTSLMSPIMHLVPDSVVKFIAMGGREPSLKDLFDLKRFEKKNK